MASNGCAELLEYIGKAATFSIPVYGGYHKWLKKRGKCFTMEKGYRPSKRIKKTLDSFEPEIKGCYGNSMRAALYDYNKDLQYYEGYYISKEVPIPIEHAWTVDKKTGRVVDPTVLAWEKHGEISYFGTAIPNEYIMVKTMKDECYMPRIGQYWNEEVRK
jgi:hypothetical protein